MSLLDAFILQSMLSQLRSDASLAALLSAASIIGPDDPVPAAPFLQISVSGLMDESVRGGTPTPGSTTLVGWTITGTVVGSASFIASCGPVWQAAAARFLPSGFYRSNLAVSSVGAETTMTFTFTSF